MPDSIAISNVQLVWASEEEQQRGLLGWILCTINGVLVFDGLALRRTRDGRLTLSYPARRDRCGIAHHVLRPIDDVARREIERQVFSQIDARVLGGAT